MVNRYTKLRIRRRIKNQKKSIKQAGDTAGKHFDKHVLGRWRNLRSVQRFVVGWLVLVALLFGGVYLQSRDLDAYYTAELPVAGGTFREGLVGKITNMNPIFATGSADSAAAQLMFSSLFAYDENNDLVPSLAKSWRVESEEELVYTVELRDDVYWHDGEQFTADDVVFTYEAIQHPDTRSFMNLSWVDIKIQKRDDFTVSFSLPNPFAPFPQSLSEGGILPEHILGDVLPGELRGHPFNTSQPIGTGPFMFDELSQDINGTSLLRVVRNDGYFRGRPSLDSFVLTTFNTRDEAVASYLSGELSAVGGLQSDDFQQIQKNTNSRWYDLPLNNGVYIFLKTSDERLKNGTLRRALVHATDRLALVEALDSRFTPIDGPLLRRQLGFDSEQTQQDFSRKKANELLTKEGWKWRSDGIRYKNNVPLTIELVTQSSDDYPKVAQIIRDQWAAVGVDLRILVVDETAIQDAHIAPHNYQALLFGISLGKDPDVFAYWHSSQSAIGGFNLSEYRSNVADVALEGGRTRLDEEIRAAKYSTFQNQWAKDNPAIALYQPGYAYVQRNSVVDFNVNRLTTPGDRFYNVHEWRINSRQMTRPL